VDYLTREGASRAENLYFIHSFHTHTHTEREFPIDSLSAFEQDALDMPNFQFSSITEQVAAHLGEELRRGRWRETMPGRNQLVRELGVSGKTVELALQLLEEEGLLVAQGVGRPRRIELPETHAAPALRVALQDFDSPARGANMIELAHKLEQAGHLPIFPDKTLEELGMDVGRVSRQVMMTTADAWIVAAASREVLEWFSEYEKPAFALFGSRRRVCIAATGPDHVPPMRAAVKRLIALGHRRIILLNRADPGQTDRAQLEEMRAHGLPTGAYNFPDWEKTPAGFHRLLDELYRVTPPTALIIDQAFLFHAAKEHLAQKGILAPKDVSLICIDGDPTFDWCVPSVAHIRWDSLPWVRRIVRWANNVSRGREDLRQTLTKAEFVDGGTIGPAPRSS